MTHTTIHRIDREGDDTVLTIIVGLERGCLTTQIAIEDESPEFVGPLIQYVSRSLAGHADTFPGADTATPRTEARQTQIGAMSGMPLEVSYRLDPRSQHAGDELRDVLLTALERIPDGAMQDNAAFIKTCHPGLIAAAMQALIEREAEKADEDGSMSFGAAVATLLDHLASSGHDSMQVLAGATGGDAAYRVTVESLTQDELKAALAESAGGVGQSIILH